MKSIFHECDSPVEILTDNAPIFCCLSFLAFADECDINVPMYQRVMALGSDVMALSRKLQPECGAQSRRLYTGTT